MGTEGRTRLAIAAGYVVVRVLMFLPVMDHTPYYDASEYRAGEVTTYPFVNFLGHSIRPWVVPFFYSFFQSDTARVWGQLAVSAACWLALAWTVGSVLRDRRVAVAGFVVILLFSCTVAVASWDALILSESLAISLAALTLAGWLRFVRAPTLPIAAWVVAATSLFLFTRTVIIPVVALLAVAVAVWSRREPGGLVKVVTAGALALVVIWGAVVVRNVEATGAQRVERVGPFGQNMALVLTTRILPDAEATEWFVSRGMPVPTMLGGPEDDGTPARINELYRADPRLRRWFESWGLPAIAAYSVTHPEKFPRMWVKDLPLLVQPPRDQRVYAKLPKVLPQAVEDALLPANDTGEAPTGLPQSYVWGLAILAGLLLVRRWRLDRSAAVVAGATFVICCGLFYLTWALSAIEPERHGIPFTMFLVVSVLLGYLLVLDAALLARRPPPPAGPVAAEDPPVAVESPAEEPAPAFGSSARSGREAADDP